MLKNSLIDLTAKDNPKIKHLRGLCEQASYRRKSQQTVLEGAHLLDAWLKSGRREVYAVYLTQQALSHPETGVLLDNLQGPAYLLPEAIYKEIRTLGPGIDIMAIIDIPDQLPNIDTQKDLLILENLQDPGNVGTLLRTAAAAGIQQIVCSQGTAAIWSPRVLRAGMGAQFSLNIYEKIDLEAFIPTLQIPVYVTSSHVTQSLYQLDLSKSCAWLMGNEGQGASDFVLENAQGIAIPQPGGQESLNVAIAGAVCMFEMVRQRLPT